MKTIYEPKGRAGEYSELALNLYTGCPHKCLYCYVPKILHKTRDEHHTNTIPRPIIGDIENDINTMKTGGDQRRVMLCFTCDPFPVGVDHTITMRTLELMAAMGIRANILTKNGNMPLTKILGLDMDIHIGASISFSAEHSRQTWEAGASCLESRWDMLRHAKREGLYTWVSLEPIIYVDQALNILEKAFCAGVDQVKLGPLNHHPLTNDIDWKQACYRLRDKCQEYGINAYYKGDFIKHMR